MGDGRHQPDLLLARAVADQLHVVPGVAFLPQFMPPVILTLIEGVPTVLRTLSVPL